MGKSHYFHEHIIENSAPVLAVYVPMNKPTFTTEWARMAYFSMENALEMIFWVRSDNSFYYVNPTVCKALGYTSSEMSRLKASDILSDYNGYSCQTAPPIPVFSDPPIPEL